MNTGPTFRPTKSKLFVYLRKGAGNLERLNLHMRLICNCLSVSAFLFAACSSTNRGHVFSVSNGAAETGPQWVGAMPEDKNTLAAVNRISPGMTFEQIDRILPLNTNEAHVREHGEYGTRLR